MIKIYEPDEKLFQNNGLGNVETLSCIETKKAGLNGWQIDAAVSTKYASLIKNDYIVVAETKEYGAQPFRIENPRIENRQIRFTARHVIFESEKYVLLDSRPTELGAVEYVRWVNGMTDKPSPFTVSGDYTGKTGTNYFVRKTLMDALLQAEETFGCIIDPYRFQIRVMKPESVGSDNGYSIIYGKNLQGITVDEDWGDVCTKILPVGPDGLLLENPYMSADVQYDRPYTKVVSFNFDSKNEDGSDRTIAEQRTILAQMAQAYLDEHKVPKVSYTVKSDVPQELKIRDIVHVKHPMLTIDARVTEYKYDCISHRVKSLTFGNYDISNKSALESRIESVSGGMIDDSSSLIAKNQISRYDAGLQRLISTMANAMGLYKTEVVSANGGVIYYYHDRPTMAGSSVVYTFNDSGFVVSTDGGQTYNAGFDVHGNAVVNVLSAIGLSADWIETGKLEVKKGTKTIFLADYDTGTVRIVADEFSLSSGKTIADIADEQISEFETITLDPELLSLQNQIDGKAETWYQTSDPSTAWTTSDMKAEHTGDLWYNSTANVQKYYRWNGTAWEELTATPPDDVFDQIDGKAQIFVSQPVPPYNVGDLWVQGASGDIMRCSTARSSGSYNASDWVKASKYTDDTAVTSLNNALTQQEIFNRLTNNGETQGIYLSNGKLYINATYIVTGRIASKKGYVYFDLDNDEIACSELVPVQWWTSTTKTVRKTHLRLKYKETNTSFYSALELYNPDDPDQIITMTPAYDSDSYSVIKANGALRMASNSEPALDAYANLLLTQVGSGTSREGWASLQTYNYASSYSSRGISSEVSVENNKVYIRPGTTNSTFILNVVGKLDVTRQATFHDGLTAYGTKNRLVATNDYDDRLLYCYEMPSPMFGDIGEAVLDENGECLIDIDDIFNETVTTAIEYQVFLQKEGQGDCWIEEKKSNYFVIKGTPNLKVAWEIKAKQRDYEYERLEKPDVLDFKNVDYEIDDYEDVYTMMDGYDDMPVTELIELEEGIYEAVI